VYAGGSQLMIVASRPPGKTLASPQVPWLWGQRAKTMPVAVRW